MAFPIPFIVASRRASCGGSAAARPSAKVERPMQLFDNELMPSVRLIRRSAGGCYEITTWMMFCKALSAAACGSVLD